MPRRKIPIRESHELRDDKSNYLDKELEAEKRSKVYTTEIINEIIKNIGDPKNDMMPFFHGKPEWRNSDIAFDYTAEEWEELQKCSEDPIYFIEKYCTFLTDYGRKTVNLRQYQKDVIHLMCDEEYNEQLELIVPTNRRCVLLQSRQTGKCVSYKTYINIRTKKGYPVKKQIFHFFYEAKKRNNELTAIDTAMYYLMMDNKSFYSLLNLGLHQRYKDKLSIMSPDDKFVDYVDIDEYIETESGFVHASRIYLTRPFETYRLITENGDRLDCADHHMVYTSRLYGEQWMRVSDISPDGLTFVFTKTGWQKIISVTKLDREQFMFDITVDSEQHSFYSNNILSHNTTTTAAIFTWYLTFHNDKNALVVANKGQTAEEILGKMTDIFKGLPFFIKPGVRSVSTKAIRFENGCSLRCSATSDTPATGDTLHMLMIDECALIPANKIGPFWTSVFPTLSSSALSQIIVLSTPRGRHNLYYDIYSGAVNGTNGFVYKRVDYWEVPGHDTEEWKQDQISAFGEAFFNQEFGLSFDSDQSKLIAPKDLKFFNRIKRFYRPVDIYGIPWQVAQKILWHPDFNPDELTYDDLLRMRFFLQIDTAEGKQKGEKGQEDMDWNIINIFALEFMSPSRVNKNRLGYKKVGILDCIRFRQIGIYMDQEFDEEKSAEVGRYLVFNLFKNGQQYGDMEIDNTRILLEINFNGMNWIKEFITHDLFYPQLLLKTFHSQKSTKKEYGFKTVSGNHGKGYYCEEGAKMIAKKQIIISQDHKVPNLSSIQQLEAFGKNKNNVYEGSCMHDDISVTILFTSVAMESDEFKMWIEDWMEILPQLNISEEYKNHLIALNNMMEAYVIDTAVEEEKYTEDDVLNLVSSAVGGFNSNQNYNGSIGGGNYGMGMTQQPFGGGQFSSNQQFGGGQQYPQYPSQQNGYNRPLIVPMRR